MVFTWKPAVDNTFLVSILPNVIIIIVFVVVWLYIMRRLSSGLGDAGRTMGFGKAKIKNVSDEKSILGTKEVNIIVNDYDDAILFLKGCGLTAKAVQETKREIWILDSCEISIDTWPWLPTFMEIEGPSEDEVWAAAQILGYTKAQAKFGSVDSTYQHYYGVDEEIVNQHTPEITFEMTPPKWAQKRVS